MLKIVAPMVGGVEASDGSWIEADEKLDGGPSVLFDAVALLPSGGGCGHAGQGAGGARLRGRRIRASASSSATARPPQPLLHKAGVLDGRDEGFVPLGPADDAEAFVAACRKLRFWEREAALAPA